MISENDSKITLNDPLLTFNDLFNNDDYSLSKLLITYFRLGLVSNNEPNIDSVKEKLLEEKSIFTKKQYNYFETLWNTFPGHTSTLILTSLAIFKSESIFIGLIAEACFYIPSVIVISLIASLIK